jgi:hypothetical protein
LTLRRGVIRSVTLLRLLQTHSHTVQHNSHAEKLQIYTIHFNIIKVKVNARSRNGYERYKHVTGRKNEVLRNEKDGIKSKSKT